MERREFDRMLAIFVTGTGIGILPGCEQLPTEPDTESPEITKFESDKPQYNKNETVYFTGSATDNVGVVEEGIDIDASVDGTNNRDLESLTSTLVGGYDRAGKYRVTGWAKDAAEKIGSKGLTLIVKPYSQFTEVQDNIAELASYSKVIKDITLEDFDLLYPMLGVAAQNELDALNDLIASSTIDAPAKYRLTDNSLIYEMNITDPNEIKGFTNDNYFGDLPLSQSTYDELYKNLMEKSTEEEARELIRDLAPDGASIDENQQVYLPTGPVEFDIVIQYVEKGQEINLSLEYKSPGDTFSTEEQERVDAFNSMFHPPYFPISALGIEETTLLNLKKEVLGQIQYHKDNNP